MNFNRKCKYANILIGCSNTRLRHAGESKRTWSLMVLKRQDPSLSWGMATVSKELDTHLNAGKLNSFRLLAGGTPSQEAPAPYMQG